MLEILQILTETNSSKVSKYYIYLENHVWETMCCLCVTRKQTY